jgi:tetratricopeptide (TPR) repeat protein
VAELARHFTEAAVLGDSAAAARWATAAARAAADQADQRAAIAVLQRALAVIEAVEPVDQAARFDVAAALGERHWASSETAEADAVRAGSAGDAARRLRSGERMLRLAMLADATPAAVDLCEEAIRLLEPSSPTRALAHASRAWSRCYQGMPGSADDVEAAAALLPDAEGRAPKVAAAARWMLALATLGAPGAARRLRWCDEALAVDPVVQDPQWDEIGLGMDVDVAGELLQCRQQSLLALGQRAAFEAGLSQLEVLAEASGRIWFRSAFHGHIAGLALLDGRFDDVPTLAGRALAVAPDQWPAHHTHFALSGWLALEQGRFAELLPIVEAAVTEDPNGRWNRAWLGRCHLGTGDAAGANQELDHLIRGWSTWARDFSWPGALSDTAELVAQLGSTDHAQLLADELEAYAGELAVPNFGLLCLGAFDRYRGMLLSVLGRHDEAVGALEAALVLEGSLDSPPLTARTRYWLGRALVGRDGPGDRQRAADETRRSIQAAERLGMAALAVAGCDLAPRIPT